MSETVERDIVLGGIRYIYASWLDAAFPYIGASSDDRNHHMYRKHENGGGLVAKTAIVASTVHVGAGSRVFGKAVLADQVRLTGNAHVGGTVVATGTGTFYGNTYVTKGTYHNFGLKEIVQR